VITAPPGRALEELRFDNTFARLGDPYYERHSPEHIGNARLVAFNPGVAAELGLRPGEEERPEFLKILSGSAILSAMEPLAAVYAGHQFGHLVPQLGDGRALLLGEVVADDGTRRELQLKGSGPTAFSRFGDGRAVLRSTIREFLASEAMHALGVPTTRALAMAAGDEPVFREKPEFAAIVMRTAPSFVRFGSFEFFHYRNMHDALRALADYTIEKFFPEAAALAGPDRYAAFLRGVTERTARLMAAWTAVGFAHGVMNTDNMSILGLTLDYGPYGFLDAYDPGFICNHTDEGGRYAFDRQPSIGAWNCAALAFALSSLMTKEQGADALATFEPVYRATYMERMRAKFGLAAAHDDDGPLFGRFFDAMGGASADHTLTFRTLCDIRRDATPTGDDAFLAPFGERRDAATAWLAVYRDRLAREARDDVARRDAMRATNPRIVLRNWVVQEAILSAEQGNDALVHEVFDAVRHPFDDDPRYDKWASAPPEWAKHLEVSCSS
jgi:uncharacterized protein YdiU (UPF0061 family)